MCWWFECCGFGWRDNGVSGVRVWIVIIGGIGIYCGSLVVWWCLSGGVVWVSLNLKKMLVRFIIWVYYINKID